jgi:hypothetical protein
MKRKINGGTIVNIVSSDVRFGYVGALGHINDIKEIGYDFSKVYTFGVEGMEYEDILKYDKTIATKRHLELR